jgi:hypothetical protein
MCSVELGAIEYSDSVLLGEERCLPACTRRRSEGVERLVRRARRVRSVEMDVFEGMLRGIVESPETVLMKICMVSSLSEAEELMLEMLDVRCIVARCIVLSRDMVRC